MAVVHTKVGELWCTRSHRRRSRRSTSAVWQPNTPARRGQNHRRRKEGHSSAGEGGESHCLLERVGDHSSVGAGQVLQGAPCLPPPRL